MIVSLTTLEEFYIDSATWQAFDEKVEEAYTKGFNMPYQIIKAFYSVGDMVALKRAIERYVQ